MERGTAVGRRLPGPERREQLLETAIDLARDEGVGQLTLARVAVAAGVTKPIAYQHFGTLLGLLQAMYAVVGDEYRAAVVDGLSAAAKAGVDKPGLVHVLCEVYVGYSLERGALHEEIGAALVAAGDPDGATRADVEDQYADFVGEIFGLDRRRAYLLAVVFLGAADRVCEAMVSGRASREEGVAVLEGLFIPQVSTP